MYHSARGSRQARCSTGKTSTPSEASQGAVCPQLSSSTWVAAPMLLVATLRPRVALAGPALLSALCLQLLPCLLPPQHFWGALARASALLSWGCRCGRCPLEPVTSQGWGPGTQEAADMVDRAQGGAPLTAARQPLLGWRAHRSIWIGPGLPQEPGQCSWGPWATLGHAPQCPRGDCLVASLPRVAA